MMMQPSLAEDPDTFLSFNHEAKKREEEKRKKKILRLIIPSVIVVVACLLIIGIGSFCIDSNVFDQCFHSEMGAFALVILGCLLTTAILLSWAIFAYCFLCRPSI